MAHQRRAPGEIRPAARRWILKWRGPGDRHRRAGCADARAVLRTRRLCRLAPRPGTADRPATMAAATHESLYGHNEQVYRRVGDRVAPGDALAAVGGSRRSWAGRGCTWRSARASRRSIPGVAGEAPDVVIWVTGSARQTGTVIPSLFGRRRRG